MPAGLPRYDFRELLELLTADDTWQEIEDLDNDGGRDYYFVAADDAEAYIRFADGQLRIRVNDEWLFDGPLATDEYAKYFIRPRG